ncbi:MAG: transposase [Phycisphaerae bacterium]
MAKPLLTDELWERIEPLLPPEPPKPQGGRPRVPDRACLTGILFVLRSGISWEYLPKEMNRGIGSLIAKRNTEHGSGLGQLRWVVEAAFAWLFQQRRLRVRYEKRDDIHQAFLIIGCLLICWNRVNAFC